MAKKPMKLSDMITKDDDEPAITTSTTNHEPVPEPDVLELCVYIKSTIRAELRSSMQSHETEDLKYKLYAALDALAASYKSRSQAEGEE